MCGTCGCGQDNHITYRKPGEHLHNHDHVHQHGNLAHSHAHDHEHEYEHKHEHQQNHSHGHTLTIDLQKNILSKNDLLAERNRGYFEALGLIAINLVSSPGSGKTTILERTIRDYGETYPSAVIEGDQQTMNDANRIKKAGAPVIQVNTGNGCHLDALMVNKAVKALDIKDKNILFIENVGNLVCPSLFDLGETKRVVIISVTEGDDKAAKYPTMFESAQLCLINKIDLLPYVDFDLETFKNTTQSINNQLQFIEISAKTGEGMEQWVGYLDDLCKTLINR
jgi:hydrogenase nickel incorporation protein HypB